jgi:serine/threonine protein kinase
VYERLGPHQGIIGYYGISDESTGAINLAYANDGDLSDYIKTSSKPSQARRAEMIRLLSAAWLHIYSHNVSIQDIKTENILVQDGVPKICDFTKGLLFPLDIGMHEICPEDTLRVDLVGIGCVIYSIAAWEVFDYDYFEEQRWPGAEDLKPTESIMCGEIIEKCWYGKYKSMNVLHVDVIRLLGSPNCRSSKFRNVMAEMWTEEKVSSLKPPGKRKSDWEDRVISRRGRQ